MKEKIRQSMYSRPTLPALIPLYPLSLLYGAAVRVRNYFYSKGVFRTEKLPCAVISIGNMTVGGSGKTPVTVYMAGLLRERGKKVAVLSRGYGGRIKGVGVVSDGARTLLGPGEAGDEPFLIARRLPGVPVVVGPDRVRAGRFIIERFSPDILLLDDGFQHRSLARDLDILLVDSATGFGNGRVLPLGPLREPAGGAGRADLIMLKNGEEGGAGRLLEAFGKPVVRFEYAAEKVYPPGGGTPLPPEYLRGRKVLSVSGIANPSSFSGTLHGLGAVCVGGLPFPDHHPYTREDLERIEKERERTGAELVVTTEKDRVKLEGLEAPFYTLSIGVRVIDSRSLERLLDPFLRGGG